jgi:hypothetical protein
MIHYLLAGLVIGCVVTFFENFKAPVGKRLRTMGEIVVFSIIGAAVFCYSLPVNVLFAVAMSFAFAIINQTAKWFWGTDYGDEIGDFIGMIPPVGIMPLMFAGAAWYGATLGAIQVFALPEVSATTIDGALVNATVWFSIISWVTVGVGKLTGDIGLR